MSKNDPLLGDIETFLQKSWDGSDPAEESVESECDHTAASACPDHLLGNMITYLSYAVDELDDPKIREKLITHLCGSITDVTALQSQISRAIIALSVISTTSSEIIYNSLKAHEVE